MEDGRRTVGEEEVIGEKPNTVKGRQQEENTQSAIPNDDEEKLIEGYEGDLMDGGRHGKGTCICHKW
jgi:hypothetical protein